jgi:hypothetical protein
MQSSASAYSFLCLVENFKNSKFHLHGVNNGETKHFIFYWDAGQPDSKECTGLADGRSAVPQTVEAVVVQLRDE